MARRRPVAQSAFGESMGRMRKSLGRRIDGLAKWLLGFRIISAPAKVIANSSYAWSFVSRTDRIRANRLGDRLKEGDLPEHVSIIMDGNRRFAWGSNIGRDMGHHQGKEKLKEVMDWILDLGIPYLTVYALSTENMRERPEDELESLYDRDCRRFAYTLTWCQGAGRWSLGEPAFKGARGD